MKHNIADITQDVLTQKVAGARSLASLATSLNLPPYSKTLKQLRALLQHYDLPVPTYKPVSKYVEQTKICPQCGKPFVVKRANEDATCCSHSCANSYFYNLEDYCI